MRSMVWHAIGWALVVLGAIATFGSLLFVQRAVLGPGAGSLSAGCEVEGPSAPGFDPMAGADATGFLSIYPLGRGCTWRMGEEVVTVLPRGQDDMLPYVLGPLLLTVVGLTILLVVTRAGRRQRTSSA